MARRSAIDSGFTAESVDEQAVALVGGHAAGAGVRLGDVPLLLEHRHVVADGGRGHAEVVPFGEGLAAHGVVGGDIVLDDGPEDLKAAFVVRHGDTSRTGRRAVRRRRNTPELALARTECQASIRPVARPVAWLAEHLTLPGRGTPEPAGG